MEILTPPPLFYRLSQRFEVILLTQRGKISKCDKIAPQIEQKNMFCKGSKANLLTHSPENEK